MRNFFVPEIYSRTPFMQLDLFIYKSHFKISHNSIIPEIRKSCLFSIFPYLLPLRNNHFGLGDG